MNVSINGKSEVLPDRAMTLQALVADRRLVPEMVIIEVNLAVITRENWPATNLQDKDVIEIISFIGGG